MLMAGNRCQLVGAFAMVTKAELHQLIDALPDGAVAEAAQRLAPLRGRLARSLYAAPPDDEPETDEERSGAEEAQAEIDRGEGLSTHDVRNALGL
jgi:hypothetical protein